jgi:hypothetical protein
VNTLNRERNREFCTQRDGDTNRLFDQGVFDTLRNFDLLFDPLELFWYFVLSRCDWRFFSHHALHYCSFVIIIDLLL